MPTRFRDFDDYWSPFLGGQGPAPSYAMSLSEERRGNFASGFGRACPAIRWEASPSPLVRGPYEAFGRARLSSYPTRPCVSEKTSSRQFVNRGTHLRGRYYSSLRNIRCATVNSTPTATI